MSWRWNVTARCKPEENLEEKGLKLGHGGGQCSCWRRAQGHMDTGSHDGYVERGLWKQEECCSDLLNLALGGSTWALRGVGAQHPEVREIVM